MSGPDRTPHREPKGAGPLPESGRYLLHEELRLDQIFTERDLGLLRRLQAYCRERSDRATREVTAMLASGVRGLASIALCLSACPPLRERSSLGGRVRSGDTLMQKLLDAGEHALEWSVPTKAVLSRTFGIAKVNFWSSLAYALEGCEHEEAPALLAGVKEAMEEAVFTRMAEELYVSFLASHSIDLGVRRSAVQQVVDLWEGRVSFATDRFCPILRSAWSARHRMPRTFGTMMGTSEVVVLLLQDCSPRFVEWFCRREHRPEELQAFEEFLFDLPFESLAKVRAKLQEENRRAVGPDDVARYLGSPPSELPHRIEDARLLYSSFRRRRVQAQYRASAGVPGPRRTAESYLLEALLRETRADDGPPG